MVQEPLLEGGNGADSRRPSKLWENDLCQCHCCKSSVRSGRAEKFLISAHHSLMKFAMRKLLIGVSWMVYNCYYTDSCCSMLLGVKPNTADPLTNLLFPPPTSLSPSPLPSLLSQSGQFNEDMIPTVGFNMRKVSKGNVTIKVST